MQVSIDDDKVTLEDIVEEVCDSSGASGREFGKVLEKIRNRVSHQQTLSFHPNLASCPRSGYHVRVM